MYEAFGSGDIPDDGQRYFVVSSAGWADLLQLDQFSRAEYVGEAQLPYAGGLTARDGLVSCGLLIQVFQFQEQLESVMLITDQH